MTINKVDFNLRLLNSFAWRLLLVIVLLLGVHFYPGNYFKSTYIYYLIIGGYFLLFIPHLFLEKKAKGIVRLLLDLTIIVLFTYNKDLSSVVIFLPYLIIIINSVNFSGSKNRYLVFLILVNLALLIGNKLQINFLLHSSLLIIAFFMIVFSMRKVLLDFNYEVNRGVGSLFFESFDQNQEHKVLTSIKKRINNKSKIININQIFVFTERSENLILIKGSKFVFSDPKLNKNIVEKIKGNKGSFEKIEDSFIIDDYSYKDTYWIKLNIANIDYYFMIDTKGKLSFTDSIFLNELKPIFNQIARVFQISFVLNKHRKEEANLIKRKISYVFDSINAMHYMKNKLSPITLKLSLIDRYFNKKETLNASKIEEIKNELSKTDPQSLRVILDKAEVLIRGVDNLILKEDEEYKVAKIIDLAKDEWIYQFNDWNGLKINIEDPKIFSTKTNYEVLGYVFTDLISNIEENSENYKELNISLTEHKENIVFEFSNDVKDFDKNLNALSEVARIYNEENNDEIYNRRTKGLSLVRRLTRYKQIKTGIEIDVQNKLYKFYLYLKT